MAELTLVYVIHRNGLPVNHPSKQ